MASDALKKFLRDLHPEVAEEAAIADLLHSKGYNSEAKIRAAERAELWDVIGRPLGSLVYTSCRQTEGVEQPLKIFFVNVGPDTTRQKFYSDVKFERWLARKGWGGLLRVDDPNNEEITSLDDVQPGALYKPSGLALATVVENPDGQMKTVHYGYEVKAGEAAVKLLEAEGHSNVQLLDQRIWTVDDNGVKVKRQFDQVAIAGNCAFVVEATASANTPKAEQLVSGLMFLRNYEDAPELKVFKGKKLRGGLFAPSITRKEDDARYMMRLLNTGFEGERLSLFQENGLDISDGSACCPSPTQNRNLCQARKGVRPAIYRTLKATPARPFLQRVLI